MWCWRAKEVVGLLDGTDECQASGWRRKSLESELIELSFGVFEKWQDVAHFTPFFRNQRTAKASSSASCCLACRVKVSKKKKKKRKSCSFLLACDLTSHLEPHNMQAYDGCVLGKSFRYIVPARSNQKCCVSLKFFHFFCARVVRSPLLLVSHMIKLLTWFPAGGNESKKMLIEGKEKTQDRLFFSFDLSL